MSAATRHAWSASSPTPSKDASSIPTSRSGMSRSRKCRGSIDPQSLVLHAAPGVDETSLLEPARRTIERVAPDVAVQQTTTMRRVLDTAIGPARQVVLLLSLLTALALTLGAVGIYGVIAHFAARRRREWAIRVALGLSASRVIAHVVGHGVLLVTCRDRSRRRRCGGAHAVAVVAPLWRERDRPDCVRRSPRQRCCARHARRVCPRLARGDDRPGDRSARAVSDARSSRTNT